MTTTLIASTTEGLSQLLASVRSCQLCQASLPLGPRPVLMAKASAKLLIVGQAPGIRVHESGIPWNDASGKRLRQWLGLSVTEFYDESVVAIVPMAFCYPGTGKSGDLPPPKICAETWHQKILEQLPNIRLTLLIGQYAQQYYLSDSYRSLTERIRRWRDFLPMFMPLVHPSPRNQLWLKKNPWFEREVVPDLQARISTLLK